MKYALLFIMLISSLAHSALKDGISFEDKVTVLGHELVLNGIGIRKATIFKIKVYYGGLYLEQKSQAPLVFLASNAPKQIVMNFVHDVDAAKLSKGFNEGLEAANKNHQLFTNSMAKFNASLEDVAKGDKIIITFFNEGVGINVKNKEKEKIIDSGFSRALLSIWFINPADEALRDGLIGLR
jgi:hypothetical protein